MLKLSTTVEPGRLDISLGFQDRIMVLGSCFADNIGAKLSDAGFSVCVNPFGTLYNPVSIANAAARLGAAAKAGLKDAGGAGFTSEDCVQMGAEAGLVCSWWHHTRFARGSEKEFLDNANKELAEASEFWKGCNKVIVSLGTAKVWRLVESGEIVANCLKRPASEFSHEMLDLRQIAAVLERLVESNPDKEFIFTISPIRHLAEGAHENTLSKARLHLALEQVLAKEDGRNSCAYFPAFEILLDELRDYRFFAEDLVHPSSLAVDIIWQKFMESAIPDELHEQIRLNEKASRRNLHREILHR